MTRTVEKILGKRAVAAVKKPIEKAGGLPGSAYTSQEFHEQGMSMPSTTWVRCTKKEEVFHRTIRQR